MKSFFFWNQWKLLGVIYTKKNSGERCAKLNGVLQCVIPRVKKDCGAHAAYVIRTKIVVGYLSAHRTVSY